MNTTNYIEKFLNEIKNTNNLSEKTIKAYKSDLIDFFLFVSDGITSKSIIDYIDLLNNQKQLKDTSIRRKIITIKQFVNYLYSKRVIKSNPFKGLKFRFKKERKLPKTLPINDVKKLLRKEVVVVNKAEKFFLVFFLIFMIFTGTIFFKIMSIALLQVDKYNAFSNNSSCFLLSAIN